MTEANCKYCGYNHGIIKDVVCAISSNKLGLPISEEKESFFAMEVEIPKYNFVNEKNNNTYHEFREYMKRINFYSHAEIQAMFSQKLKEKEKNTA